MSRAQPKSAPQHQHARRIAAAIAKGRAPALTPDLDLYLESSPREIFVAFEGVARHMPGVADKDICHGRAHGSKGATLRKPLGSFILPCRAL
jgi:hypothetical protein